MRLNHIDLPVPDVAATRDFFETWLGFTHERTLGQDGLAILRDAAGLVLVLSRLRRDGAQAWPIPFHIGFHLDSPAAVSGLQARMAAGGLAVEPPSMQHGAFAFYLTAPGDILVEVAHQG
ncbi:VOC family protein [Caulobacter sp. UNC279MFTsu5.1]|uniref:VOC family protein n=1 Tax=Caulobacter sp. UNC279MFTsu5.1 TaxID=1502775 RepID=UPI0008E0E245|nr:VOC family protein [Caulobacter sp. UNC279MFTsu5.1]SFK52340.1 Catechol 2,3-dioxygenase [Caulobacter sp. UNC279MFTsu5.1]